MKRNEEKRLTSLDVYLAAFLSLYQVDPILEVSNGRVVFTFPATERVNNLMIAYNTNTSVPVAAFVAALKSFRGRMIAMREMAKRHK